jgi:hypothetical protein
VAVCACAKVQATPHKKMQIAARLTLTAFAPRSWTM